MNAFEVDKPFVVENFKRGFFDYLEIASHVAEAYLERGDELWSFHIHFPVQLSHFNQALSCEYIIRD